jgi:hypothetical protein
MATKSVRVKKVALVRFPKKPTRGGGKPGPKPKPPGNGRTTGLGSQVGNRPNVSPGL